MGKIIVVDVETPNRYNDKICSIGLTIIDGGRIIDTLYYLINPETSFDKMNIDIHGIKPEDVLNAPNFPVVWNEISDLFCTNLIAAHNAVFDLNVLRKTLLAYGISESIIKYVCTLKIASSSINEVENYKLPTLCRFAGIELQHHDARSDSRCCAELLCIFMNFGIDLDDYMNYFNFKAETKVKKNYNKRSLGKQSESIVALKDVISAVTCDNALNESEVVFLQNWLNNNRELEGNYPYDRVFDAISTALADGILEQSELDALLEIFKRILDPVQSLCISYTSLDIKNKNIVLTGEFDRGDRNSIKLELENMGAACKNSVTKHTHYVIVGGQGSSMWSAGNYGNKVKKALELQANGASIQIIREENFYNALEN